MRKPANFKTVLPERQNANPLHVDAKPETDLNAKWPLKVNQSHLFQFWVSLKSH